MKDLRDKLRLLLRNPRTDRVLQAFGIDPKRYWLLMDLFAALSDRGEVMDQLGRSGVALQVAGWIYAAIAALIACVELTGSVPPIAYLGTFLALTGFLLFFLLLSEAGNSLVNPSEGLILAHQPIDGATYTAAKLSHLLVIVFSLVPAINAIPAAGGFLLADAAWWFPFVEFASTLALGLIAALLCCALYGWMIRLLPPQRLKAAGQLAGTLPFVIMTMMSPVEKFVKSLHLEGLLPTSLAAEAGICAVAGALVIAAIYFGIRSLSADYLLQVTAISHGGSRKKKRSRRFSFGENLAARVGGQPGRAGYAFVSRMARRDFQFRRQAFPTLAMVAIIYVPMVARGWRKSPFEGHFTTMHFVPHLFGFVMFFLCSQLIYGAEYKGRWIFNISPMKSIPGFARGVYSTLYLQVIVLPHALLLPFLISAWGPQRGILFVVFSAAISSIYLAFEMRLVEVVPFTRQMVASGNAGMIAIMMMGGLAMAAAVAIQYYVIFRSTAVVLGATILLVGVAAFLTRLSAAAAAHSFAYNLALTSGEAGPLYREIEG